MRRRRLPLESLVMVVLGMALYRGKDVWSIADKMQIALPGRREFVAPSAVVQGRQRLGSETLRDIANSRFYAPAISGCLTHADKFIVYY